MSFTRDLAIPIPQRRRYQYRLRTLFIVLTVAACVVGWIVCRDQIGSLFFRKTVLWKTSFSTDELNAVERTIRARLTPNSVVKAARLYHSHDAYITVRLQMPVEEAEAFKQSIPTDAIARGDLSSNAEEMGSIFPDEAGVPVVEAVLTLESALDHRFVFCSPKNGFVTVYVEIEAENDNFNGVWEMFQ